MIIGGEDLHPYRILVENDEFVVQSREGPTSGQLFGDWKETARSPYLVHAIRYIGNQRLAADMDTVGLDEALEKLDRIYHDMKGAVLKSFLSAQETPTNHEI